jgi:DNA gyrase subunit A
LIECSDRNGPVVGIAMVKPEDEVMLITDRGQTIRTPVEGIRETSRNTQGVKLMSIADDERVVAIEPIGESSAPGLDEEGGPDSQALAGADADSPAPSDDTAAQPSETDGEPDDGGQQS